jgi:hypothetical protein
MLGRGCFALCWVVESLLVEYVMTKSKQHATHPKEAVRPPAQSADSRLDEALEESFPASDPIAVDMSEPRHPAVDEVPSAGKKRH